jgi:ketosteroid isomerase-like protein
MEVESRELTINLGGDFAFSDGVVRMTGTRKESETPVQFSRRETMCFERHAEGWRIVHAHTSAPLPTDGRARRESMASSKLRVGWAPRAPGTQPCGA